MRAQSPRTADGRAYVVRGFNVTAFFEVLGEVVAVRNSNWELLAKEIGVIPSTLTQRAGGRCPDAAVLAALSEWAGINPADFVAVSKSVRAANSLAAISQLMRCDPSLDPKAVQALESIIRVAYSSVGGVDAISARPRIRSARL